MDFFNFLNWRPWKASTRNESSIPHKENTANLELEQSLKRTMERYKCVSTVLEQQGKPCIYEFHTTSKGIPVLLCMHSSIEIKLYNLNNNPEAECRLKLKAEIDGNTAKIIHITGGILLGHGRLAVSRLVSYCAESELSNVECTFVAPSKETSEIFSHFFTKLGFIVSNTERNTWEAHLRLE